MTDPHPSKRLRQYDNTAMLCLYQFNSNSDWPKFNSWILVQSFDFQAVFNQLLFMQRNLLIVDKAHKNSVLILLLFTLSAIKA